MADQVGTKLEPSRIKVKLTPKMRVTLEICRQASTITEVMKVPP